MSAGNMTGIFANAVDSIRMGIEDHAIDTPARASSAVRNFYAGVLLLGKEVLIRAAPLADADAPRLADPKQPLRRRRDPIRGGAILRPCWMAPTLNRNSCGAPVFPREVR